MPNPDLAAVLAEINRIKNCILTIEASVFTIEREVLYGKHPIEDRIFKEHAAVCSLCGRAPAGEASPHCSTGQQILRERKGGK